ncbi:MAG: hypothetical protein HY918_04210 [Candidatus Doudnabacteria bacterium]|nr:hypothetical protein [Candidatus Doudnabacteria bacterium]
MNNRLKRVLITKLQAFKNQHKHWNGPQQQLFSALSGKRGLWSVRCCAKCLEEVIGSKDQLNHHCGELIVEVQIKEPKKVPGDYVSAWE